MISFQRDLILNVFQNSFYNDDGYYTFDQDIILSDASSKQLMLKHTKGKFDKIPDDWSITSLYISFIHNEISIDYMDNNASDYIRLYM